MAERQILCRNTPSDAYGKGPEDTDIDPPKTVSGNQAKIQIFGKEMIEKRVKASANSGRVYLPPDWIGHKVKIIRID